MSFWISGFGNCYLWSIDTSYWRCVLYRHYINTWCVTTFNHFHFFKLIHMSTWLSLCHVWCLYLIWCFIAYYGFASVFVCYYIGLINQGSRLPWW
jgi:hypothetical protein